MKTTRVQTLITALSAGLFLGFSTVHGAVWDGGGIDSEFSTAANWDDDITPTSGASSTSDIDSAVTVSRTIDSSTGRTFIDGGAILNVSAGAHDDARSGSTIYNFLGRGSSGTLNVSGGTYRIGHQLSIGGGGSSGNGVANLTGGTLDLYRGANSIIDNTNPHGRPSLEVSDEENAGSGLFEISGGSLMTRFGVGVGQTGTFSVVGSAGSIEIGRASNSSDGTWLQQAGGILSAAIDGGGITPILLGANSGNDLVLAEFKSGAILDLSFFTGTSPTDGTWTILEAENADITDGGLGLAAGDAAAGWSFNIDNSGANGLLTATYAVAVPEPSTYGLIVGLIGLAVVIRRRR